jgi:leucyl-tRNA synthetase
VAEERFLGSEELEILVQVDGRLCDKVYAQLEATPEDLKALARESPHVRGRIDGREVLKEIVVPGRLVNFVTRP